MHMQLDTMNHTQRARFGRALYRRPAFPPTVATRLYLERIISTAKKNGGVK